MFPPVNQYRNIRNKSRSSHFSFDFDLSQYQMKFIKNKLSLKFDFSTNFGADKNDFGLQKAFLWQVFHLTGASDQSICLMKSYYCYLYVNKWDHIFSISKVKTHLRRVYSEMKPLWMFKKLYSSSKVY